METVSRNTYKLKNKCVSSHIKKIMHVPTNTFQISNFRNMMQQSDVKLFFFKASIFQKKSTFERIARL